MQLPWRSFDHDIKVIRTGRPALFFISPTRFVGRTNILKLICLAYTGKEHRCIGRQEPKKEGGRKDYMYLIFACVVFLDGLLLLPLLS